MKEGPDIARIAALIGDPARANMLVALMDGRALTATELAAHAGVTKQTASAHLAKLTNASLLACEAQGRNRYFRVGGEDVAATLEALIGLAERHGGRRVRIGPSDPALRKARVCYDHLAGEMGVELYDALLARRWIRRTGSALELTEIGTAALGGLDVAALSPSRKRPACRACLDWSQRKHHLAGSVGKAILQTIIDRGWATRREGSRAIDFSPRGEAAFRAAFCGAA